MNLAISVNRKIRDSLWLQNYMFPHHETQLTIKELCFRESYWKACFFLTFEWSAQTKADQHIKWSNFYKNIFDKWSNLECYSGVWCSQNPHFSRLMHVNWSVTYADHTYFINVNSHLILPKREKKKGKLKKNTVFLPRWVAIKLLWSIFIRIVSFLVRYSPKYEIFFTL